MKNDEINLQDNINEEPVNKSELFPIYQNMGFAGDIQPLEDVQVKEEIPIDYSAKKTEIKSEKKSIAPRKSKKVNILFKNISITRIVLSAVIVLALIGGIIAIVNFAIKKSDSDTESIVSVYTTQNESTEILFADGTGTEILLAQKGFVSQDGRFLYYAKTTSSKTGKYDIYLLDATSKKSIKKGGKIIEIGVDDGWQITLDGKYVCYSITEKQVVSYYLYNAESDDSEIISDAVVDAYLPNYGDTVYYTISNSVNYSLNSKKFGEKSELIANNVSYVKLAQNDSNFQLLYTVPTNDLTNVDVYMYDGVNTPTAICKNVSEVYIDDYVYGGNLYYFMKVTSNVSWQDFIDDRYYDTDASLEKPSEGDYMVKKGFIFKRYVLDSEKYNKAVSEYNQKCVRDSIRARLDSIDLGLSRSEQYTCYAYNNSQSVKLVNGITLDNVIEFSTAGEPRIIYRKSIIGVDTKITMDELVKITGSDDVEVAIDYVIDAVSDSYEVSNNCIYAIYNTSKVLTYEIDEYELNSTKFILGSNDNLFAENDGNLYINKASSSTLDDKILVDTDIEYENINEDVIYYIKNEASGIKCLYKYDKNDTKTKICDNVDSYFISGNNIIILSNNVQNDSASIGIYANGKYTAVDSDISLDNLQYTENSISYLKNYNGNSGGELYCYSVDSGVKKLAENAVDIIYTK